MSGPAAGPPILTHLSHSRFAIQYAAPFSLASGRQAHRQADEVVFMHRGRRLEQTPADEFFEHPRSEEARAFLAGELLG